MTISESITLDLTRPAARVQFAGTPARRLPGAAAKAMGAVLDLADLVVAAEQLGAMSRCIETTAEYAKLRMAFGQPIGAFQGVKHPLADLWVGYEMGAAAVRESARCAEDRAAFTAAASAARVVVSPAYFRAARSALHFHGGLGYTWEHDAHLYYRNALGGQTLLGSHNSRLDRLWRELAARAV